MGSSALVYCLQPLFLWNGTPLAAGRLPFYGTEVANVSYARGHQPTETVLFRLDSEPVAYLAGKAVEVWFAEPLPIGKGTLEVRAALVPCADREVAADRRLRTPADLLAWEVELRAVPGLPARTGRLAVGRPFAATLALGPAGTDERFELELTGGRTGTSAIGLAWHRYANPGRPQVRFVPAHRPFDPPVVRLRPE